MANPSDISQGTDATPVNVLNWNVFVDRHNELGNKLCDVKDYGAGGDGNDEYTEIAAAHTDATVNGSAIRFPSNDSDNTYLIGTNLTFNDDVTLVFEPGASIKPDSGITITINGDIRADLHQIFDLTAGGTISLSNKAPGVVFPQWWGAVGDGVTDDTTEIQAALNAVGAMGGGKVLFVGGTYIISSSLGVYGGTILEGVSNDASVIKSAMGDAMLESDNPAASRSYYVIRHLTFDNTDKATASGIGLNFDNISHALVEDVIITNVETAISMANICYYNTFIKPSIVECDTGIHQTEANCNMNTFLGGKIAEVTTGMILNGTTLVDGLAVEGIEAGGKGFYCVGGYITLANILVEETTNIVTAIDTETAARVILIDPFFVLHVAGVEYAAQGGIAEYGRYLTLSPASDGKRIILGYNEDYDNTAEIGLQTAATWSKLWVGVNLNTAGGTPQQGDAGLHSHYLEISQADGFTFKRITAGGAAVDRVTIDSAGDVTVQNTSPEVIIHNTTEEDGDGGREGNLRFKGEQSGTEIKTLATIVSSHDGAVDDEKGKLEISTNDGNDGDAPTLSVTVGADGITTIERGVLALAETTTPSAVGSVGALYTKSDNELYFQDGAGIERAVGKSDYAGIYASDNAVATTILLVDAFEPITIFTADMPELISNGAHGTDSITIGATGVYEIALHTCAFSAGVNKVYAFFAFEIAASGATITDVTQANPGVVTAEAHGFTDGQRVKIAGVVGMTELNGQIYTVANKANDTFELNDDNAANINTGGYVAYDSAGTAFLATRLEQVHIHRKYAVATDIGAASTAGLVSLTLGNTVEAYVKGLTDATNLTFCNCQFFITRV